MARGVGGEVTLFLAGDVMTGRGIDQILPCPSAPELAEPHVEDARVYVDLAEKASGPVPRGVEPAYVWGDAPAELDRVGTEVGIVNLETSITRSDDRWPGKGIHYRMHPANVACLKAGRIDVCALANNHVLDYGEAGLRETLETLVAAGLRTAGAGRNAAEAWAPAVVDLPRGRRVLVWSFGSTTSGIPPAWAATAGRAGVALLRDLSTRTADEVVRAVGRAKRAGDVVIASIHWGDNWGYDVPAAFRRFARALVDGGVDVVHGHSSHHPRPLEVYRDKLVLYGCGDFIDDYEGIAGYEAFRDDLVLAYVAAVEARSGRLARLRMLPFRIRAMRLVRASLDEAGWLRDRLNEASRAFASRVELTPEGWLELVAPVLLAAGT
jgi:poly-gamma-glutamate synthesis protein (capsule biosynthesis protein)